MNDIIHTHWGDNDEDEDLKNEEEKQIAARKKLDDDYPDYSEESKNAAMFIGQNYPYVPGDD